EILCWWFGLVQPPARSHKLRRSAQSPSGQAPVANPQSPAALLHCTSQCTLSTAHRKIAPVEGTLIRPLEARRGWEHRKQERLNCMNNQSQEPEPDPENQGLP